MVKKHPVPIKRYILYSRYSETCYRASWAVVCVYIRQYAYEGKYHKGEAKKPLFGSRSNSADVLVYPPVWTPGHTNGMPIAVDFMVTGSFCLTNASGRTLAKKFAASSDTLVFAGEKTKWTAFRAKVRAA